MTREGWKGDAEGVDGGGRGGVQTGDAEIFHLFVLRLYIMDEMEVAVNS